MKIKKKAMLKFLILAGVGLAALSYTRIDHQGEAQKTTKVATVTPNQKPVGAPKQVQRIVTLGDSITDGETFQLLWRQALREARRPMPIIVNAGVSGDTAAMMLARLDRDVLAHKPDMVTIMAGTNDALRGVTPERYEAEVAAIAEKIGAGGAQMLFITPPTYGPAHVAAEPTLLAYEAALKRIAKKHNARIADFHALMLAAQKEKRAVITPDDVHLELAGYKVMVRTVLDALGDNDVKVPKKFEPALMPGIIASWQMRAMAEATPLDEKTVLDARPDATWKTVALPETTPQDSWWPESERKRGFAMSINKTVGEGMLYQGVAYLDEAKARTVYFNTGAELQTIWLNGKQIYKNEKWTGWHAGKERIKADLQAGRNSVVIEAGSQFFLSITPTNNW